jgi:hypothetical protein
MEMKVVRLPLKMMQKMQHVRKDIVLCMLQEYDIYRIEVSLHIGV